MAINTVRNSNEPFTMDGGMKMKRPTLKEGIFGYSHANHMKKESFGTIGMEVNEMFGNPAEKRIAQQMSFMSQIFQKDNQSVNAERGNDGDDSCKETMITCNEKTKRFRTPDGSCNNLRRPSLGKAETAYHRILPKKQSLLGKCNHGNVGLRHLPNSRLASRMLIERISEKSRKDRKSDLTVYTVIWGQVLDHDLLLTPLRQTSEGEFLDCCDPANDDAEDCCSIKAPRGDFFYGRNNIPSCMPFIRSKLTEPMSVKCQSQSNSNEKALARDVENSNTHYLDASYVYGSSHLRATNLRTLEGGQMKTSTDRTGRSWPPLVVKDDGVKMEFGDERGDVTPHFTLLVTAAIRFHNLIAKRLSNLRQDWDDERIFQETRKIVIAIHQHITYTQWMDEMIGNTNDLRTNDNMLHEDFYNPKTDPSISMIFSTAAFRLHTLVPASLHLRQSNYKFMGALRLRDVFHHPLKLLGNNTYDDLMRGMTLQPAWDFNNIWTQEMTEFLFAEENNGTFGMDIVALNLQRGRDHQIQGYSAYRDACGLGQVNSWNDMTDFISHKLVHRLLHTYRRPEDVEAYIGIFMESKMANSLLGPTAHCIIQEQFKRTRNGDRHFYTRPSVFSGSQLRSIKNSGSLSHLLCAVSDKTDMFLPRNMFKRNLSRNPLVHCSNLEPLDLQPWTQID